MKLGRSFFMVIVFAGTGPAAVISNAQCVYHVIRVSRIQGAVLDPIGAPIPNVEIKLKSDERMVATATTDEAGKFFLAAAPGKYDLLANARGFVTGFAPIDVGKDLARAVVPTRLWMILDVGMTTEQCTFTTTSRREFENNIREHTQKH